MKRAFTMLVTVAMILSLVGCSSAPPNTGSSAANSSLDESTDSPGDTSQYNNDSDGDTGYTDDITYNPSRDYVTGDNYTPIMDVETSTWGGSSDIDMGDMVSYCLSNITYGIDDGYSDGFYVVTISGSLNANLAPYAGIFENGSPVWMDVEISYHNDVYECNVNNQTHLNSSMTLMSYMVDCYRQYMQNNEQAAEDQKDQETIEANRFSNLSTERQKIAIGWPNKNDYDTTQATVASFYDSLYEDDPGFAQFADWVFNHYKSDYTLYDANGIAGYAGLPNGRTDGTPVILVYDYEMPVGDYSIYLSPNENAYDSWKNYNDGIGGKPGIATYFQIWKNPGAYFDKSKEARVDCPFYYGEYVANYKGLHYNVYVRPMSSVKAQLALTWTAFSNYDEELDQLNPEVNAVVTEDGSNAVIF